MRVDGTPYIEWAKLKKGRWNLSPSGVPHAAFEDIGVSPSEIVLTGDNAYGYAPLLERIAAARGVDSSRVVTATGCSMACFLALAAIVEPGDEVLIERPTYEPLLRAALHLGARVTRFDRPPSRAFAIDPAEVAALTGPTTRAIVLANLHNPSSQAVDQDALRRIGEAAEKVGARILVDEVYLDAIFDAPPPSCVHLGPAFISTGSLTKIYGLSALRCGWVIADRQLARRIWRLNDLYENSRPFAPDWLAAAAFDRLPALRARSRALLDANRRRFAAWMAGRTDLAISMPAWGTTVCARPTTIDADTLCHALQTQYDVTVVPGRFFELPDHIRIGLCVEPHVLDEGLARLAQCLDRSHT
jgi:aspartate/methionine/tyrosine aminotransferase